MGLELAIAAATLQGGAGVLAFQSAQEEAKAQKEVGALSAEEAFTEAERVGEEGRRFETKQKLAFLKSGVRLEGSPLLVLQRTREEIGKEVSAIERRGLSQRRLARKKARITRRTGRGQLISSIAKGAGTISGAL